MNSKQNLSLVFLILGLIFSSILRIRFNASNGFEFQNYWITVIPSLFDFAALKSSDLVLSSTFLGYIFFAVSGLVMLRNFKAYQLKTTSLTLFLGLTLLAFGFELFSVIQDISSTFGGQHLRIGFALFLFGLFILIYNYRIINHNYIKY